MRIFLLGIYGKTFPSCEAEEICNGKLWRNFVSGQLEEAYPGENPTGKTSNANVLYICFARNVCACVCVCVCLCTVDMFNLFVSSVIDKRTGHSCSCSVYISEKCI